MGDRRMAEIVTEGGSLYVYSHSGGYMMAAKAEDAIKAAQPRWGDPSYATRIVVDQLIKDGRDSELGYGLMLKPNAEDEYNETLYELCREYRRTSTTTTPRPS